MLNLCKRKFTNFRKKNLCREFRTWGCRCNIFPSASGASASAAAPAKTGGRSNRSAVVVVAAAAAAAVGTGLVAGAARAHLA